MSTTNNNKLAEVEYWLIYFEDKSAGTEIFTDESAARARLAHLQLSWACHLFASMSVISRLLDAAHVDALRAAANAMCEWCRGGNVAEEQPDFLRPGTRWHKVYANHLLCGASRILALVPERARLERELEMVRALFVEARFWIQAQNLTPQDLIGSEKEHYADLEAKLAELVRNGEWAVRHAHDDRPAEDILANELAAILGIEQEKKT